MFSLLLGDLHSYNRKKKPVWVHAQLMDKVKDVNTYKMTNFCLMSKTSERNESL